MEIEIGSTRYEWIENWAHLPADESAARGWAHPGLTVTRTGHVVTCHPGKPEILFFNSDGELLGAWSLHLIEAHGITSAREGQAEYLWIADNGHKPDPQRGYQDPAITGQGRVVKTDLEGTVVLELSAPPLAIYRHAKFAPTSIAVWEEGQGGNGDVWIADGYGQSYVHRYDRAGIYRSSVSGEEGKAGRLATPHAILIDRRKSEPELYISDRINSRVQVYDLDGHFKRAFGSDFLLRPGGFAPLGDWLVIADLFARLAVVDENDRFVGYVGANDPVVGHEGWPNRFLPKGETAAPRFEPGRFNSPHAIASDAAGNLYVAEWVIGGRTVKLRKLS